MYGSGVPVQVVGAAGAVGTPGAAAGAAGDTAGGFCAPGAGAAGCANAAVDAPPSSPAPRASVVVRRCICIPLSGNGARTAARSGQSVCTDNSWPTWQWRLLPFRGASAKPQFMYAVALTLVHQERDVCAWVSKIPMIARSSRYKKSIHTVLQRCAADNAICPIRRQ